MKIPLLCLVAAGGAGFVTSGNAEVEITTRSSSGTAFASTPWSGSLSGTDLINSGQPTLSSFTVSTSSWAPVTNHPGIHNGTSTHLNTTNNTFFSAPGQFPAVATFYLNTGKHPQGYVITSAQSFMGWSSNSATHGNQNYKMAVRKVGSTDFIEVATVNYAPFGTANSSHHESHVLITAPSGEIATGVDGVRLTFTAPVAGGTAAGTAIREIDVFGYPVGDTPPPDMVTLTLPVSRQVIQRGAANSATVTVAGSHSGHADAIEARVVVMSGAGNSGTETAWAEIVTKPTEGTFTGTLANVAAGGWYQLEVRPVVEGIPGDATVVQRIGVGDIYVTCGQSNSANYGSPAGIVSDDRVSAWNYSNGAWTKAADPMPGATGRGGSVWTRLGDLLAARDNVPVAFACLGVGSTTVSKWAPPGGHYLRIKTAVQAFPAHGFKAVLWHQGESDSIASTPAATYQSRLTSVIAQSRTDAGWTVPWHVAEASFHPRSTLTKEETVVAAQRRAVFADPQVFPGPVTDDFHREGKLNDAVHFNAAGLADHAAQWAEVLGGKPGLTPKNGDFESNQLLPDGGVATINMISNASPSIIGWRALADSGEAAADGSCGYYNPDNTSYTGAADGGVGVLPNMSGRHVAFISGSTSGAHFLQTRRVMLKAAHTYVLTAAVGMRNTGTFGGAILELLANGATVASRSITKAELDALNSGDAHGKFTDVSLSFSTGSTVPANQPLALRIRKVDGAGTYLDFDNVRLSSAHR